MKYEKKTEHLIQKVSGWRAFLLHVCQEISVGLTLMEDNIYWFSSFWDRDIVPVDSQQYTHIISLTCLEAHPPQKAWSLLRSLPDIEMVAWITLQAHMWPSITACHSFRGLQPTSCCSLLNFNFHISDEDILIEAQLGIMSWSLNSTFWVHLAINYLHLSVHYQTSGYLVIRKLLLFLALLESSSRDSSTRNS